MARSGNTDSTLLFMNDHILIQDNEDKLQCSVCNLHSTGEVHNVKVSTRETKVMAFKGKFLIRIKILLVIIY
jgi:hypothetical protein